MRKAGLLGLAGLSAMMVACSAAPTGESARSSAEDELSTNCGRTTSGLDLSDLGSCFDDTEGVPLGHFSATPVMMPKGGWEFLDTTGSNPVWKFEDWLATNPNGYANG